MGDPVVDPEIGALDNQAWSALTSNPAKVRHYAAESAFRHGWMAVHGVFGDEAVAAMQRVAMVIVLPEALATRRADRCMAYLRAASFTPLLARTVRLTGPHFREMWRYQANVASYDSLVLGEMVGGKTSSVLLVLRDDSPSPRLPASVRLSGLKGPALPSKRHARHLRSVLGALNRVFVMVHCSDEPIDVVRELAVAVECADLTDLVEEIGVAVMGDPGEAAMAQLRDGEAMTAPHPIDVEAAVKALRQQIERRRSASGAEAIAGRAESALMSALDGRYLNWRTWSRDLLSLRIDVTSWEVLLVATEYIDHELPGARRVIDSMDADAWHRTRDPSAGHLFTTGPELR